jgi:hypothetical protein
MAAAIFSFLDARILSRLTGHLPLPCGFEAGLRPTNAILAQVKGRRLNGIFMEDDHFAIGPHGVDDLAVLGMNLHVGSHVGLLLHDRHFGSRRLRCFILKISTDRCPV